MNDRTFILSLAIFVLVLVVSVVYFIGESVYSSVDSEELVCDETPVTVLSCEEPKVIIEKCDADLSYFYDRVEYWRTLDRANELVNREGNRMDLTWVVSGEE